MKYTSSPQLKQWLIDTGWSEDEASAEEFELDGRQHDIEVADLRAFTARPDHLYDLAAFRCLTLNAEPPAAPIPAKTEITGCAFHAPDPAPAEIRPIIVEARLETPDTKRQVWLAEVSLGVQILGLVSLWAAILMMVTR